MTARTWTYFVETRDVWSLQPGISFSRTGGANEASVELEEENLFGRGKDVSISWSDEVERESILAALAGCQRDAEPLALGARVLDQRRRPPALPQCRAAVLLTRHALERGRHGVRLHTCRSEIRSRHIVDEFKHEQSFAELRGGWSAGLINGRAVRWLTGFRYDDNHFANAPDKPAPVSLPPDHTLVYPWVGIASLEDRFVTTANLNKIGRTEDLDFGTSYTLQLGWASKAVGSDRDAAILGGTLHSGLSWAGNQTLFFNTAASGRIESGQIANGLLDASARYYWRWALKKVFFAGANAASSEALDPENQLQLGGDNGLRGYPLRYQTGHQSRAVHS